MDGHGLMLTSILIALPLMATAAPRQTEWVASLQKMVEKVMGSGLWRLRDWTLDLMRNVWHFDFCVPEAARSQASLIHVHFNDVMWRKDAQKDRRSQ
jgi:hypothetical protein